MPRQTLTKISGEPTHTAVKHLERELAANLIAVECPWGLGKGYLGKVHPVAIFTAWSGGPYIPPAATPPVYPNIPPGTTTPTRKELKAINKEAQKNWQTHIHVHCIVVNQAAEAIKKVYYTEIEDPTEGLNGVENKDFIDHICDHYCHIDQADLDANLDMFHQGIDPSLPPIVYIRKQEDCQEFAKDGQVQISEETMVTTKTKHVLQCVAFTDVWKDWNGIP
jgi:hypothetical protein